MKDVKRHLIVISGGGTGGPSTAPLALATAYRQLDREARFIFVGSDPQLEQKLFAADLQELGADYYALPAGKWRRYLSWQNFLDVFKIIRAFFLSIILLSRWRPSLIISAGSFASVPLVWAGRCLGVKILVHQQDLRPGLANRLMAPLANKVSVAFAKSLADYGRKAVLIGNPGKLGSFSPTALEELRRKFKLDSRRPLILVTGGGSGSLSLNKLFFAALPLLPADWQIIHQVGQDKGEGAPVRQSYQVFDNISHDDFSALWFLADIVVSRAGLGALTEAVLLAKPTVLMPIPKSQQEDNAAYFAQHQAAIVLDQDTATANKLAETLKSLWQDEAGRQRMSAKVNSLMPTDAAKRGAEIIQELLA